MPSQELLFSDILKLTIPFLQIFEHLFSVMKSVQKSEVNRNVLASLSSELPVILIEVDFFAS